VVSSAETEAELVRVCRSAADPGLLRDRVLRCVRRLIPVDAAFFATADPQTLLFTGAWSEEPLDAAAAQFLDNEFGDDDVNAFAALATAPAHVATLDSATRDERFASRRYREIMRPLGLGDELRAALVVGGRCWGYLCLHRTDDPRGFTAREIMLLERLGPHIAAALRRTVALGRVAAVGPVTRPGVLMLADDLSLVASTPEAQHLLALVGPDSAAFPLPTPVHSVAAALLAVEGGALPAAAATSITVPAANGQWITLHAARLHGPGNGAISVVIDPMEPAAARSMMLDAQGLTRRETDVATLVLRGASTREIAAALHISANTVQDHLKSVFDKTGVRSRRELVGLLLGAH
jgi:DNA-binding CsgD family transcriptional regulator